MVLLALLLDGIPLVPLHVLLEQVSAVNWAFSAGVKAREKPMRWHSRYAAKAILLVGHGTDALVVISYIDALSHLLLAHWVRILQALVIIGFLRIIIVHRLILCLGPRSHAADVHALTLLVRSILQLCILLLLMSAVEHLVAVVWCNILVEAAIQCVLRRLILPVHL